MTTHQPVVPGLHALPVQPKGPRDPVPPEGRRRCPKDATRELFLYSEIDEQNSRALCKQLRVLDGVTGPPIMLRIQSPGGDLVAALLIVDTIKGMHTPVHTRVDGFAASCASLVSTAGARGGRSMHMHSCMLIHEASKAMSNKTSSEMDIANANLQAAECRCKALYEEHTRLRGHALDTELKRDLWLDAPTCLKYGLVDHVLEHADERPYFSDGLITEALEL